MKVKLLQRFVLISAFSFRFLFENLSADAQSAFDPECIRLPQKVKSPNFKIPIWSLPPSPCTSGTITGTIDKSITPTTFCNLIQVLVYKNDFTEPLESTQAQTNFQDSNSCIYSIKVGYLKEKLETRFSVSVSVDNYSIGTDPVFVSEISQQGIATRNFILR